MKETRYLAYFKGRGYYAKYQLNYSLSFTEDINEALRYKTPRGALSRINWGSPTQNGVKGVVFIEEIETIKKGNVVTIKNDIVGKLNIKEENEKIKQKNIESFRKKVGEKTFKLVDEPLKVKIEKLNAEDSFWG